MIDKSWLLNPSAIQAAKNCILAIEEELGIKLKLSHPHFLGMITEYAELTDSDSINRALAELVIFSGGQLPKDTKATVISLNKNEPEPLRQKQEMIRFKGKLYPKYSDDGLEFRGLYRGQARYT